ncbi:MAG: hypothetical protein U0P45_05860 [Acidimicrobiales bacterium]
MADLVTLRAADLGLDPDRDEARVGADLVAAQAAVEQLQAERAEAQAFIVQIEDWEAELAVLDERIAQLPDEIARWTWLQQRNKLDRMRAQLAALDQAADGDDRAADARLLQAVEELRSAGETWAEASTAAHELAERLGPLPPVSGPDLARVAQTPDELPADLDERIADIQAAHEVRLAAEQALEAATAEAEDPGDLIVYELARLDQDLLWNAHNAAVEAQAAYDAALAARDEETDPDQEAAIEAAHGQVVACQRDVEQRFRPGILGASTLAVGALLAGVQVALPIGVVMLVAAVAMAVWLLVVPRKALAAAQRAEEEALSGAEAGSWLGLHLRRIDHVMSPEDRTQLSTARDVRTTTRMDWEQLVGTVTLEKAGEREDAIRTYAAAIDPEARAARERIATEALDQARKHERASHRALLEGLEGYGLTAKGALDLDPSQIHRVLEQRVAAGRFAREAVELQHLTATATSSGAILDRLLAQLGFTDGDLPGRLERAIIAVEAARRRHGDEEAIAARDELEAAIAALAQEVEHHRRIGWDVLPSSAAEEPPRQAEIMDARRELAARIQQTRRPDLADVERRLGVASDRVRSLEAELAGLAQGATGIRRRLADRIGRTTWLGDQEECLPLLVDDAFAEMEPGELFKLLDMIVRLSSRTQVVLLTSDATIARWARREAEHGTITLLEADAAPVD